MSPDTLLQWLEGRLVGPRALEVALWVVSNPDPELPALMRGLLREGQQREDDSVVRENYPEATWLLDAWSRLLSVGRARLSVGEGAPIHVQFASAEEPGVGLYLEEEDEVLACVWDGPREGWQGFVSDDAGQVRELVFVDDGYGLVRAEMGRPDTGRWTFWMVHAVGEGAAGVRLRAGLDGSLAEAHAVRYDSRW